MLPKFCWRPRLYLVSVQLKYALISYPDIIRIVVFPFFHEIQFFLCFLVTRRQFSLPIFVIPLVFSVRFMHGNVAISLKSVCNFSPKKRGFWDQLRLFFEWIVGNFTSALTSFSTFERFSFSNFCQLSKKRWSRNFRCRKGVFELFQRFHCKETK